MEKEFYVFDNACINDATGLKIEAYDAGCELVPTTLPCLILYQGETQLPDGEMGHPMLDSYVFKEKEDFDKAVKALEAFNDAIEHAILIR